MLHLRGMKNNPPGIFASTLSRFIAYMCVITVGSILVELIKQFTSGRTTLLGLSTLVAFVLVGAFLICKDNALSRTTSASVMLVLGTIAMRFGHAFMLDAYLFVLAMVVSLIGALPFLHRQYNTTAKNVFYSLLVVTVALILFICFTYGMILLDRMTFYPH